VYPFLKDLNDQRKEYFFKKNTAPDLHWLQHLHHLMIRLGLQSLLWAYCECSTAYCRQLEKLFFFIFNSFHLLIFLFFLQNEWTCGHFGGSASQKLKKLQNPIPLIPSFLPQNLICDPWRAIEEMQASDSEDSNGSMPHLSILNEITSPNSGYDTSRSAPDLLTDSNISTTYWSG
jgi:hypothetical protein